MTTNLKNIANESVEFNEELLEQIVGGKEPYSNLYLRPPTLTEKLKAAGVLD